jgi:hypothetical protein
MQHGTLVASVQMVRIRLSHRGITYLYIRIYRYTDAGIKITYEGISAAMVQKVQIRC